MTEREAAQAKAEKILSSQPEEARLGDVIIAWSIQDVTKGLSLSLAELAQLTRRVDSWFKQILADALQRERDETERECIDFVQAFAKHYPEDVFPWREWPADAQSNIAGVTMRDMMPRVAKALTDELRRRAEESSHE